MVHQQQNCVPNVICKYLSVSHLTFFFFCADAFAWSRWYILLNTLMLLYKYYMPICGPISAFVHIFIRKRVTLYTSLQYVIEKVDLCLCVSMTLNQSAHLQMPTMLLAQPPPSTDTRLQRYVYTLIQLYESA